MLIAGLVVFIVGLMFTLGRESLVQRAIAIRAAGRKSVYTAENLRGRLLTVGIFLLVLGALSVAGALTGYAG